MFEFFALAVAVVALIVAIKAINQAVPGPGAVVNRRPYPTLCPAGMETTFVTIVCQVRAGRSVGRSCQSRAGRTP